MEALFKTLLAGWALSLLLGFTAPPQVTQNSRAIDSTIDHALPTQGFSIQDRSSPARPEWPAKTSDRQV